MSRPKLDFDPDSFATISGISNYRIGLSSDDEERTFTMQAPQGPIRLCLNNLHTMISWLKKTEAYYQEKNINEIFEIFKEGKYNPLLIFNPEERAIISDLSHGGPVTFWSSKQERSLTIKNRYAQVNISLESLPDLISYMEKAEDYYFPNVFSLPQEVQEFVDNLGLD